MTRFTKPLGYQRPLQPIIAAHQLGTDEEDRKITLRFHCFNTGWGRVYDFGPNVKVWYRTKTGKEQRNPRTGDWFVRFADKTWRFMSPDAYTRYNYLLQTNNISNNEDDLQEG